jgi:zinc protease
VSGVLPDRLDPPPRTGPRIAVRRVEGVPVVAFRAWVPGGAEAELSPGTAWATGQLLLEGTRNRSWERIAEEAEQIGAGLFGFAAGEVHGVGVDALADDWELALDWGFELLLDSVFPAERVRWVARQGAAELAAHLDRADVVTAYAFLDQLYAPHPRSRPPMGAPGALVTLEGGVVAACHRDGLERGPLVTVAGRIDPERVEERLRASLERLPEGPGRPVTPSRPAEIGPDRRVVETPDDEQAHLYLGHLTVPRLHADYPALELASVILGAGSGLTGRIPFRLRDQEGLGYSVSATCIGDAGAEAGRLVLYVGTSPDTVERAEAAAREELERLLGDGIGPEELESSRTYLEGQEPFRRETARQWSTRLAESLYWGLPLDDSARRIDSWRSLSVDDVNAALRRHVHPGALRVTVGLPPGAQDLRRSEE